MHLLYLKEYMTFESGMIGLGIGDFGLREGMPLMRHEYIWGMYTGGGKPFPHHFCPNRAENH
jgi:hypothetical protein